MNNVTVGKMSAVAMDTVNGFVYYGDYSNKEVKRATFDGSEVTTVFSGKSVGV